MSYYLYGAAVQGIQEYIFRTNKLKDIVQASQQVNDICTALFVECITGETSSEDIPGFMKRDKNFILHAAGNIKYIFQDESICQRVVRCFPRRVMETAPGISLSQAVVCFDDGHFAEGVNELERRLRIQRNKPVRSQTLCLMGIQRNRRTGLPNDMTKESHAFNTTNALSIKAFGSDYASKIPMQTDQIARDDNRWIAVIHADGNGLGSIVQRIGTDPERFKSFSERLDDATCMSAQDAFNIIRERFKDDEFFPIRPIILGGDDLTIICRGDLALDYTTAFIQSFENRTTGIFDGIQIFTDGPVRDRMSACAGIAYVKASYPFYFAYELAESLCAAAKKDAKDTNPIKEGRQLPQSCILFHKVQDSFNERYEEIVDRELTPCPDYLLQGGPYYLKPKEDRLTVDSFKVITQRLQAEDLGSVRNAVRKWLSELYRNEGMADQVLQRAMLIRKDRKEESDLLYILTKRSERKAVIAYDALAINTVNTQSNNI